MSAPAGMVTSAGGAVMARYWNGLGAASGSTGSVMTSVSTGTLEVFCPVSSADSAVPGIADAPSGVIVFVVTASRVVSTVGVTVASSDFWSALSAEMVAVLTRSVPLASGGMSSSTFTGMVITMTLPGARPISPPPRSSLNETTIVGSVSTVGLLVLPATVTVPFRLMYSGRRSVTCAFTHPSTAPEVHCTWIVYSKVWPGVTVSVFADFWIEIDAVGSAAQAAGADTPTMPTASNRLSSRPANRRRPIFGRAMRQPPRPTRNPGDDRKVELLG